MTTTPMTARLCTRRNPRFLRLPGAWMRQESPCHTFGRRLGFPQGDREARRFVRQLGRWIDSGGDPALLPSKPPPPRVEPTERPSMSELWRESRARRDAVDAVRQAGRGKDRAKLRSMLEAQLAARGLSESPLKLEQTLDHLWDSPAEEARQTAQGVKSLGKIALGVLTMMRGREHPDLSTPQWLEPHDRASYPVPRNAQSRWTAVRLDPGAGAWIEHVDAALPRAFGATSTFDAWLDKQLSHTEPSRLAVHIGEQQVGTLDADATTVYTPIMDDAAQRDELPYTQARLTLTPESGYLLELRLPPAPKSP